MRVADNSYARTTVRREAARSSMYALYMLQGSGPLGLALARKQI